MKQQTKEIFANESCVEMAFLFGSRARGRAMPSSDLDIAVWLKYLPPPGERVNLRTELADKLSKIFGREVELVIINNAGSLLKFEIARSGKLLFERQSGLAKTFRHNSIKEYFDYLPTFNFHYNRMKGQNHGQCHPGKKTHQRFARKKKAA